MRFSEDRLDSLRCSDGVTRPLHIWAPQQPRAVFLAIHGGLAHAGDYVTPALYFRAHGVATVALDMVGHDGKRRVDIPGFDSFLQDAVLTLRWIEQAYPGLPVFVLGHSMGALIATHLERGLFAQEPAVKGYVLSSPYYVNAVKVPALLVALSGVLARLFPRAKVPMESLTPLLTHDAAITARHYTDERDGIRATEASFRFANALLGAQAALGPSLARWSHPLFAVVAGDDRLADAKAGQALLKTIAPALLTYRFEPKNFHENFNESNRERIFEAIQAWLEQQLPPR